MANCLFDCWKMRPKPLTPKVELGSALTMWQRVNEVPPLVSFKRQTPLSAGMQHRTHPHCPQSGLRLTCDVALQKPINKAGQRADDGRSQARYHPSGESIFSPARTDHSPRSRGTYRYA